TVQLLSALQEALLSRLLPSLVACKAPLAGPAAAGGFRHLGPSTALADGAPEAMPSATAAPGGGGNSAVGLLVNAHPAAALLCRAAADLAVAASEPIAGAPHPCTTGGTGEDNRLKPVRRAADNGDGCGGHEPLKQLVALCCEMLAGSAEIEKEAEAGARGSGGGLSVGQLAASYTLTAVCIALARDLGASWDGKARQ
ncbi:hypothetical protein Vafri_9340, partial [Volvox africanus]